MQAADIVRAYYAAFNGKDFDAMLALVDDGVVHFPNQGDVRTGKAAFREFVETSAKAYGEQLTDMVIFTTEDPERIAVEFVVSGIYLAAEPGMPKARGQSYALPAGAFLNVRDGKIQRVTTYYNLKDWLEQVSLP